MFLYIYISALTYYCALGKKEERKKKPTCPLSH